MAALIADGGSTKCEWCLSSNNGTSYFETQGLSPYFLDRDAIAGILQSVLVPQLGGAGIDTIKFYGTGCKTPEKAAVVESALSKVFPGADIAVTHDLMGAVLATCGTNPGLTCILGTGSNSCFFNGTTIVKNSPGIGYILGDEGSGAYLGKKVIQYYLYNTFDEELKYKFDQSFHADAASILDSVYKKPLANRYLASYAKFLSQNRGHYMIENIIEDGLNDFFFYHLCKYAESWTHSIHFVGGVADAFRDVIIELCNSYEFDCGLIIRNPIQSLVDFHQHNPRVA
jgi:glucosamine kinase